MQSEKPSERVVPILGSANSDRFDLATNHRRSAGNGGGDLGASQTTLIPRQQVACLPQDENRCHDAKPHPVVHFSRCAIGSCNNDLHEVQR